MVTPALASGGRVPKPKLINLSASTKGQVGAHTATYALTVGLPSATKSESVTFRLSADVATLTFFGGKAGRHTFHQTSGVMPGGTWMFALVDIPTTVLVAPGLAWTPRPLLDMETARCRRSSPTAARQEHRQRRT